MSCGVPLVATTGGALPEVVGADGVTALQVPPGDSDALAQKIGWALEQTNLRSVVGAAGRERVIQNFSWKITAERTVEHYRALLAEVSAMLTVDYEQLGVNQVTLSLTWDAAQGVTLLKLCGAVVELSHWIKIFAS